MMEIKEKGKEMKRNTKQKGMEVLGQMIDCQMDLGCDEKLKRHLRVS
jgi:hypothetical protein